MRERLQQLSNVPHAFKALAGGLAVTMGFIGSPITSIAEAASGQRSGGKSDLAGMIDHGTPRARAAETPNPYPYSPTTNTLRSPKSLPGYHIGVSTYARNLLKNATVTLYYQDPPMRSVPGTDSPELPPPPAYASCTGDVVDINNVNYVSSAAHCSANATEITSGLLNNSEYPNPFGALDFVKDSYPRVEIEDPLQSPDQRQPLAVATGISISTTGTDDTELLKLATYPIDQSKGVNPRQLGQFASLPFTTNPHLIPGQKVGLFATQQFNNFEPVRETGIYLGRITNTDYENGVSMTQKLDVVLTHPDQPYDDAGYYAASGSHAIAQQTRNGHTTGNRNVVVTGDLSRRINLKYDPYFVGYLIAPGISDPNQQLRAAVAIEKSWQLGVEEQLGIKINPDDTILEYTDPTKQDETSLLNAFGQYAPPYPLNMSKGGGGMQ